MRENRTYSLSGGRWPARKRATSDPTARKRVMTAERRGLTGNKLRKKEGEPLGTTHYGRTGHAGETLFAETEAASEGEAGTEVPVLRAVRPDLSAGHTGRGMEAGARQSGRSGRGRPLDRPER